MHLLCILVNVSYDIWFLSLFILMQGITWWHMWKLSCVEELIDNSFPDRLQFQITIVLFLFRRHATLNDRTTNSNYNIERQNSFEISLTLLYLNSNVLQMSKIGSFSLCASWLMTLAFMEVSLLTLVCYVTRKLSLERSPESCRLSARVKTWFEDAVKV